MTLPEWLDPLYSPDEMRAADRFAIEQRGIFELELAEKAGAGLASAVEAVAESGPIHIVVGPGNNGGDGLVAARLLREAGYQVDALAPLPLEGLEGVPRTNLDRLPGPAPQPFDAGLLRDSGAIVDALLGTGFEGAVGEPLDEVIVAINAQEAPVVAADVPSGVNAATGEVEGPAVEATVTSTNHAPKIGLYVGRGARHAGSVQTVDIGIPRGEPGAGLAGLTSRRVVQTIPARSRRGSKLEAGTVLVAGGARNSIGAPCLAALAAMRGGACRVRLAVPTSTATVVSSRLLEALVHGLQRIGTEATPRWRGDGGAARDAERGSRRDHRAWAGMGIVRTDLVARAIRRAARSRWSSRPTPCPPQGRRWKNLRGVRDIRLLWPVLTGRRVCSGRTPPGSQDTGSQRRGLWRIAASLWYCSKKTTLSSCHPAALAR